MSITRGYKRSRMYVIDSSYIKKNLKLLCSYFQNCDIKYYNIIFYSILFLSLSRFLYTYYLLIYSIFTKLFSKISKKFFQFLIVRYNPVIWCNVIILSYFLSPLNHIAHVCFSFWINQGQKAYLALQIDTYYRSNCSHFLFSSLSFSHDTNSSTFQQLLSCVKLLLKKSIRANK